MKMSQGGAAILLTALLWACAPTSPGDIGATPVEPATPRLAQSYAVADDGRQLPLRVWLPDGKVAAAIVALHGFNDYSNAFTEPAEEWAKHGIATYAYDQRGFGEAPFRGYWVGSARLAADAGVLVELVRQRHPKTPVFIVGESMGGAVAIVLATSGHAPPIDGMVLSAPAIWGRNTMTVFERVALWIGDRVVPGMTLTGRGLRITPSDNAEMLRALGRDPLVIKETRVDTIKGLVDLMDEADAAAPNLKLPVLFLYGEHDEIIPRDATEQFLSRMPADATRRVAYYAGGYHMLLRDIDAPIVRRDVEAWIADPAAALPSGADRHAGEALLARH